MTDCIFHLKNGVLFGLLALGLLGSVLFFPLPIRSRYTCFYHLLLDEGNPIVDYNAATFHDGCNSRRTSSANNAWLLKCYIHGYGLFWWFSLIVIAGSIYGLYPTRHRRDIN